MAAKLLAASTTSIGHSPSTILQGSAEKSTKLEASLGAGVAMVQQES